MKLTFEEKKLLYTYGCADLELTRKRLYEIAGLTVDPNQNKLVYDFCRKLEDETLADWYDQMFYFVRAEMECYTNMLLLMQDIEEDENWGPTIFDEFIEGCVSTIPKQLKGVDYLVGSCFCKTNKLFVLAFFRFALHKNALLLSPSIGP